MDKILHHFETMVENKQLFVGYLQVNHHRVS